MELLQLTDKKFQVLLNLSTQNKYDAYCVYYGEPKFTYSIDPSTESATYDQKILYKGNLYKININVTSGYTYDYLNKHTILHKTLSNFTYNNISGVEDLVSLSSLTGPTINNIYSLDGCIILMREDVLVESIDWEKVTINNKFYFQGVTYDNVFDCSISGDGIITDKFIVFIPKDNIPSSYDSSFRFDDLFKEGDVKIPDYIYDQIMTAVGGPFITNDEFEYTKEQILTLIVRPAMDTYFTYVPKTRVENFMYNGYMKPMKYEFPSDAIGITNISYRQGFVSGLDNLAPMFFSQVQYSGQPYGYGMQSAFASTGGIVNMSYYQREAFQSQLERYSRTNFDVIYENGKKYLQIVSNKLGTFDVKFSIQNYNFEDIVRSEWHNFIEYCQWKLKYILGTIRAQGIRDDKMFDYKEWMTGSLEPTHKIEEHWAKLYRSDAIIRK